MYINNNNKVPSMVFRHMAIIVERFWGILKNTPINLLQMSFRVDVAILIMKNQPNQTNTW